MGSSENYNLSWSEYRYKVYDAFNEMRMEGDFFDVYLTCDKAGGRLFPAHRMILSACSPFFKNVFRNASSNNLGGMPSASMMTLYLKGCRPKQLDALLDFMYNGRVTVHRNDLKALLAVAEDLQVKGLCQDNPDAQKDEEEDIGMPGNEFDWPSVSAPAAANDDAEYGASPKAYKIKTPKRMKIDYDDEDNAGDYLDTSMDDKDDYYLSRAVTKVQREPRTPKEPRAQVLNPTWRPSAEDQKREDQLDLEVTSRMEALGGGRYKCTMCGKIEPKRWNFFRHYEVNHINTQQWDCGLCDQTFTVRFKRSEHRRLKHGIYKNPSNSSHFSYTRQSVDGSGRIKVKRGVSGTGLPSGKENQEQGTEMVAVQGDENEVQPETTAAAGTEEVPQEPTVHEVVVTTTGEGGEVVFTATEASDGQQEAQLISVAKSVEESNKGQPTTTVVLREPIKYEGGFEPSLSDQEAEAELDSRINKMIILRDGMLHCRDCGKTEQGKYNMFRHIEAKHIRDEDKVWPCQICEKILVTRHKRNEHRRTVHGVKRVRHQNL